MSYKTSSLFPPSDSPKDFRQIFLAKVLTGKAYECKPDESIQLPPTNSDTGLRYDSVKGTEGTHIIYENGRSYPEYLISYTYNHSSTKKIIDEEIERKAINCLDKAFKKMAQEDEQRSKYKNAPTGGVPFMSQPFGNLFGDGDHFGSSKPSNFAESQSMFGEGKQSSHNKGDGLFGSSNKPARPSHQPSPFKTEGSKAGMFGTSSQIPTSQFGQKSDNTSLEGLFGRKITNNSSKPPKTIEEAKAILRKAGKNYSIKVGDKRVYYQPHLFGDPFRVVDEPPKKKELSGLFPRK